MHVNRWVIWQTGHFVGVDHIAGGHDHSCAAMADGTLKCWGENRLGMLGDGTDVYRRLPVAVVDF
jgi:alpha-tubulin suppressor-like RCC1 family protein